MSDKSRRKILKSIAAGGGAILAGEKLPESWTRPVVDSVLLPVHAQTSPPTLVSCDVPVGGISGSCPTTAAINETTYYQIRTASVPCGFEVINVGSSLPAQPYFYVRRIENANIIQLYVISVGTAGPLAIGEASIIMTCGEIPVMEPFPIPAVDELGNCYRIDGTIFADINGASISNLMVTPVTCP